MAGGFEMEVHPYCKECGDFSVKVDEIDYDDFFNNNNYKRIITCKFYKRCEAIERYLRKEINKNEGNTSKL